MRGPNRIIATEAPPRLRRDPRHRSAAKWGTVIVLIFARGVKRKLFMNVRVLETRTVWTQTMMALLVRRCGNCLTPCALN